jgi:hypothetical protein
MFVLHRPIFWVITVKFDKNNSVFIVLISSYFSTSSPLAFIVSWYERLYALSTDVRGRYSCPSCHSCCHVTGISTFVTLII